MYQTTLESLKKFDKTVEKALDPANDPLDANQYNICTLETLHELIAHKLYPKYKTKSREMARRIAVHPRPLIFKMLDNDEILEEYAQICDTAITQTRSLPRRKTQYVPVHQRIREGNDKWAKAPSRTRSLEPTSQPARSRSGPRQPRYIPPPKAPPPRQHSNTAASSSSDARNPIATIQPPPRRRSKPPLKSHRFLDSRQPENRERSPRRFQATPEHEDEQHQHPDAGSSHRSGQYHRWEQYQDDSGRRRWR